MIDEEGRALLTAAVGDEGECRFEEPMAKHTTLRIGGAAAVWVAPSTIEAVGRVRQLCATRKWPSRAVGAGSNLLVRDGGVRAVVMSSERLRRLEIRENQITVGAGVATGKLLSEATRRDLGGVEFLGGVPGSVGGGLMMNAGTLLGEFKDVTTRVRSVDANGQLVERSASECGFVYRGSAIPPSEMVVDAELHLRARPRAEIEAAVRELRDRRRAREPHGFPNAGSIFKNPPGEFAGRLIEACGLKGRRVGGAEISPAHANWIVNVGGARGSDVLALIDVARSAVRERFAIELELEVKIVGDDA